LGAFNDLPDKENYKLNLVGEKADNEYLGEILNYIRKNKLSRYTSIKFNLNYRDIQTEYRSSDIFVLPSHNEPAGYVVIEALAHGLPVICASDCGNRCYVEESGAGFVYKSKNKNDLIRKIESISKKGVVEDLSKKAIQYSEKYLSEKKFMENFNSLNEKIF